MVSYQMITKILSKKQDELLKIFAPVPDLVVNS